MNMIIGILNSELMNWRFHLASYNNHVSIQELLGLPLPIPRTDQEIALEKRLATEVKDLVRARTSDTSRMESLVFQLYSVSPRSARAILRMRSTPPEEISNIMKYLKS
jgi:hypothetical protein